jgi:hypothetical protein
MTLYWMTCLKLIGCELLARSQGRAACMSANARELSALNCNERVSPLANRMIVVTV